MTSFLNNPANDADFLLEEEGLTAFVPREGDRRQVGEDGPPWITDEGFVMEERREGIDRRNKKPS